MDFKSLNDQHKRRMEDIVSKNIKMDWEDSHFMDTLLGKPPAIRATSYDKNVTREIQTLHRLLEDYNPFLSDKTAFLQKVNEILYLIYSKEEQWYGISYSEIEECLQKQTFCIISGEGGIGKSYFVMCLEDKLTEQRIPHLCLYGKFLRDIAEVDAEEIIEHSTSGFVFILDALNEIPDAFHAKLLDLIRKLKKNDSIHIIVTYRTNAIDSQVLEKYQKEASFEYKFPGVSFESALSEIMKTSTPDVYKYENILFSHNALWLSLLCEALSDTKIANESENSIASITFILEHHIKQSIKRTFKHSDPAPVWRDIKRIAKWMYEHSERDIDDASLNSVIKPGTDFLGKVFQLGIMGELTYQGKRYYYFSIDLLTDYLIARSLFDNIKGKDFKEQVSIISQKSNTMYTLKEAFIIVIFDNFAPDYGYIKRLLKETKLIDDIQYDTLIKINFNEKNIFSFLQQFQPGTPEQLLTFFGGYTDKPFNCSNYLNDYFGGENQLAKITGALSQSTNIRLIKARLKNLIYFITLNNRAERRTDEAFFFSIWCCSAPNKDVRELATKLLFEVICKEGKFISLLISWYTKIKDLYIRESIIFALAYTPKGNKSIKTFFILLTESEDSLTAKSIKRIASYLGDDYGYIKWNRKVLYQYDKTAHISEFMDNLLLRIDLSDKYFMPFRYWGKDSVTLGEKFIENNKEEIMKINAVIQQKYLCVKNGECSGLGGIEEKIRETLYADVDFELLDTASFLSSFEKIVRKYFYLYHLKIDVHSMDCPEEQFKNSLGRKCFDIALGVFQGSLMCNYFTNNFGSFNSYQNNIGYEVFDPLENGEGMNITSPIPTFHDYVQRIADAVVVRMDVPIKKDILWVKDSDLTRRNILSVSAPVEYNGIEWIMLAGSISLGGMADHSIQWRDTYDWWCCTSEVETLTENAARKLTIELDEYTGNLFDYENCQYKPWLCKRMNTITSNTDLFDETDLVLPPSTIVKFFDLQVCVADMSWRTSSGEIVILCDNNKHSYFADPIGGTVFIKKAFFDDFIKFSPIKFFAFTERFIPETGYADETAIHFEIQSGKIVKELLNADQKSDLFCATNPQCRDCQMKVGWDTNIAPIEWDKLLGDYML